MICHRALAVVTAVLSIVYLHGPSLGGLGFWNGIGAPDVCAQITGVRAGFWAGPGAAPECDAIIRRQVHSLAIVLGLVALTAASAACCAGCSVAAVIYGWGRAWRLQSDAPAAAPAAAAGP